MTYNKGKHINTKLEDYIKEAYIDKDGNLKDFDKKIYDFDKIGKLVDWFKNEYEDYSIKQGWSIFDSDDEAPNEKYDSIRILNDKEMSGYYWQVQRLDDPEDNEALFGKLKSDEQAYDLARKTGLMVDEYGVVYGWDGKSFI